MRSYRAYLSLCTLSRLVCTPQSYTQKEGYWAELDEAYEGKQTSPFDLYLGSRLKKTQRFAYYNAAVENARLMLVVGNCSMTISTLNSIDPFPAHQGVMQNPREILSCWAVLVVRASKVYKRGISQQFIISLLSFKLIRRSLP